jgi:hypothetical protein
VAEHFRSTLRKSVTVFQEFPRTSAGRKLASGDRRRFIVRTLSYLCFMLVGSSAFAQVQVEVTAPPPPRIEVHAPPPPRVVVPPPPRVVVPPPPRVVVPPPPRVEVRAPRVVMVTPPAPTVRFEAPPPLVAVEPGVEVVEDADDEIFFSAGYYWHRGAEGTWWRTRNYRGGWVVAPARAVPVAVMHLPHGHYRHYHAAEWHQERREIRREIRHERREERREHHGHH